MEISLIIDNTVVFNITGKQILKSTAIITFVVLGIFIVNNDSLALSPTGGIKGWCPRGWDKGAESIGELIKPWFPLSTKDLYDIWKLLHSNDIENERKAILELMEKYNHIKFLY